MQKDIIKMNENVKRVLDDIQTKIKNNEINEYWEEKYASLIVSCEELVNKTDTFYEKNEQEQYKVMTLEDKDELLNLYQNVANACSNIIDGIVPTGELEKNLFDNTKLIGDDISKDIRSLVKVTSPCTLPEVVENGRTKVIDITGKESNAIGANLSSRLVIDKGDGKAVFTEESHFNYKEELNAKVNQFSNDYPEYKEIFKELGSEKYFRTICVSSPVTETGEIDFNFDKFDNMQGGSGFLCDDLPKNIYNKAKAAFQKDKNFGNLLYHYFKEIQGISNQTAFIVDTLNVPVEERVDTRNSAMSVVAELLGMKEVICHSENVIIKDGDQEKVGTLMDFAKGVDINNIDPNSEIAGIEPDKVEITANAKKQIADIQILDYLCGNLDRHLGNMFYQYDLSDKDHPKLTGIQGIDNDCSFYNTKMNHLRNNNRMIGLSNLILITDQTAQKIKSLTPAMLKISLMGLGLNKEAIDKAAERLTDLQTVLQINAKTIDENNMSISKTTDDTNVRNCKINIVKNDQAWDKIEMNDVARDRNNRGLFTQIPGVLGNADDLEYLDDDYEMQFKSNININKQLKKNERKLDIQIKTIDKGKWVFRGSSKQYNDIQKEMKELKKYQNGIAFDSESKEYKTYFDKLQTAKSHVQAYLDRKEQERQTRTKPFSKYTEHRIKSMQSVLEGFDIQVEEMKETLKGKEKIENRISDKKKRRKELTIQKNQAFKGANQKEPNEFIQELMKAAEKDKVVVNSIDDTQMQKVQEKDVTNAN